jgi:hypothetical protein
MIVILALGSLALATVVLSGWLLFSLHGSQERISARIDSLARRLAAPLVAAGPAGIQRLAPNVALLDLDGRTVALSALMATSMRVLLNFTDPKCGPCYELLADVGGWEHVYGDRLTIVNHAAGTPARTG